MSGGDKIMRWTLLIPVFALLATLTTGCSTNPPCEKLPAPSQVEQEAARGGAEVEREIKGAECVVVGDRWVDATDEA